MAAIFSGDTLTSLIIIKKYPSNVAMSEKITNFACGFGEGIVWRMFLGNIKRPQFREVAQLVSVHVWGACGRQFESGLPDQE